MTRPFDLTPEQRAELDTLLRRMTSEAAEAILRHRIRRREAADALG
ncbi:MULTISPECIES: hypothetical protein [unclassified Microbacterium]